MTSGKRRRMIVAVRTSEQFRLQRLSKPEQWRQRRYRRRQTVPDIRDCQTWSGGVDAERSRVRELCRQLDVIHQLDVALNR